MFALQPRQLTLARHHYHRPGLPASRRHFIQHFGDGFLDLALALPLPPDFPAYSATIILVTVVSRFVLLPVSIWGKRRVRRAEEIVMPEVEALKPAVAKSVLDEMRAAGLRGTKEELRKMHSERCIKILTAKRKELFKQYKCSPLASIVVPPLSQLPVFVGLTLMFNRLSQDPTPFDSESFLTLTSLAHPDPTMTLPVVLGFLTMANVESGNWVMNAAEKEQRRVTELKEARRIAEGGKPRIHPGKIIKTALRGLSVLRIVIAAMTPGSVALYWTTSAVFGLFQTWVMEWLDARRKRNLVVSAPQPTPARPVMPIPPLPSSHKKATLKSS
ncbi:60Kd inner membrane protein-domain-containing protein [Crepidotus variabilis]|uniref:60Kd inner membrane protein-domain-containing protein n=1 Tax=Crepidotus variabilis TaxID=179855 RepID=A0A9P6JUG0_9AGAR|nr:60Kd inner membrane protein-domain-containing protein [Crepidotus variabilis]